MTEGVAKPIETLLLEARAGLETHSHSCDAKLASTPDDQLGHAFFAAALENRDRIALTTPTGSYSYADLMTSALDVRCRLMNSPSFIPGSRVLLLLPNSPEYLAAFYGTLLADGVAVPLAPRMERHQFESIRQSTGAMHVITQSRIAQSWTEALNTTQIANALPGERAAAGSNDRAVTDGLAAILFTGGSSGTPKGVMLSHQNLIKNARSIQQYLSIRSDDRPLCVLPFYHAFGNSILQSHLLAGSHLIIGGNATFPETLIEAIVQHRATSLSAVPDLFRYLLERSSLGTAKLPSLSYMAVAGGALPHELGQQVVARIAPARFFVMYGQTEATARLAYVPPDRLDVLGSGCIGRPVPGVELEVVDESGIPVVAGAIGEIRARGPNIMLGYWRDPTLTSEIIREGWLYTGDLGTVDENGWIYHRGRCNALIKIAGYRIHPSDVENFVMRELPIQQAVLVPFELAGLGTRLALYVRRDPDARDLATIEILARCRAELPRHMVPDLIQLVDEFPLNDAMKIDRPRLMAIAAEAATERRKTA